MKAALKNSSIYVKPSKLLLQHIKSMESCNDMPKGIKFINSKEEKPNNESEHSNYSYLISDNDREFIQSLNFDPVNFDENTKDMTDEEGPLLSLKDLAWLRAKINQNANQRELYLHELLENSILILPQNEEVSRSEELNRRCQILKNQQQNREYKAMTKNVDNVRKPLPEDTISYQVQQINKQLIAVSQFIFSVLAGFAFGFIGVELIVGSLDFGFRLLLGVICSLAIALAELYFLAKKLNEDLQYEVHVEKKTAHSKNN